VTTGDGTYASALRTKDKAGNESPVPSGQGSDSTVYDSTAPTPGTATGPQYARQGPISVSYSGANDSGSGLKQVSLYVKKDAGAWTDTGQTSASSSGSFSFDGFSGEGTYYFATVAEDKAGSTSPAPSGSGTGSTIFDTTPPSTGTISAPTQDDSPPISLLYSGITDSGNSGLATVTLWAKKGTGGTWTNTNNMSPGESGSFSYSGMSGDDTYYFALQTQDNAGNVSAPPSGNGQASTVYDTSFTAGTAASPKYATQAPIVVTYDGAGQAQGGPVTVTLWFKKGATGTWTKTALTNTGASGQFNFTQLSGDDTYYFGLQADNGQGKLTAEPFGNGDTSTMLDTVPPTPLTLTSDAATNQTPIIVDYAGVSDTGSGVKEVHLWVKKDLTGSWEDTGLFQTAEQGNFQYDTQGVEGRYFFYIQVEDNAGLKSPPPTDNIVFGTTTP